MFKGLLIESLILALDLVSMRIILLGPTGITGLLIIVTMMLKIVLIQMIQNFISEMRVVLTLNC